MSDDLRRNPQAVSRTQVEVDAGLRSFLMKTFNTMALGIAFTGLVTWFVGGQMEVIRTTEGVFVRSDIALFEALFTAPIYYVLMFAPLVLSFIFNGMIWRASPAVAYAMFFTFAGVFGLAVTPIMILTPVDTIFLAFLMAAVGFIALSMYGYVTNADLSSWGTFGRIGILIAIGASIIMFFVPGEINLLTKVINVVVAVASLALTAFSMQMLKGAYYGIVNGQMGGDRSVEQQLNSAGISGALALYINFMNLFMSLLSLLRER